MPEYTTNFVNGFQVDGVPTMGMNGLPPTRGSVFFVDYVNGSDGNNGSASFPLKTVYRAHAKAVAGRGDVVVVVSDGSTTGTQRLSLANAQAVDSTVSAGTLVWSKNNTHLVGLAAPTVVGQRARFAPPSGTYTQATFGSGNFVTVTASGCIFANLSVFNGFSTGGSSQIAWTDSGGRNYYSNVMFGGAGDAASAQSTSSRSLLLSGTAGENTFDSCEFGLDTVTRTVANATLEFSGGIPRNTFRNCNFVFQTSASTPIGLLVAAASGIDRWQKFDNCTFVNNVQSTSTTMSGLSTLAASAGGLLLMKSCTLVGISEFGTDATSRGQIYVDGAAPTAGSSGIAVNPT
jgi:hypothetical protein